MNVLVEICAQTQTNRLALLFEQLSSTSDQCIFGPHCSTIDLSYLTIFACLSYITTFSLPPLSVFIQVIE